jgi:exopolyphosphatase/guanosine-5'-triphosphate,3'-diphosphate pyrophosphatase
VADGKVTRELERRSTVTRLGTGVDVDGRLRDDAMQRVSQTLNEYAAEIARCRCDVRLAVLTSAVRDSTNGAEFAATVRRCYGLEPHVLTGDQEARLTFLGATSERDPSDRTPVLVLDIGGGSTEIVIGAGGEAAFHVSTQAGVVRQTERYLHHDPPTTAERTELSENVREIVSDAVPESQRRLVQQAIAVAGTATSLAAIAQDLEPYDPERVHGYQLTEQECERILARLARLPLAERRRVAGLHADRAPTIIAGALIFRQVIRLFELDRVEVSEHDILRGAALGLGSTRSGKRSFAQDR